MNDMQRKALEQEFDEKSARLSDMLKELPQMQEAHRQYEAALRARIVKEAENAALEETEEMKRMSRRCQQAQDDLNAATQSGDPARIAQCKARREDENLALSLAERRMREAYRLYQEEIVRQGFMDEETCRAAFLSKAAFARLEKTLTPFREEYAALLSRCEEIEALLGEEA